MMTRTGKVRGHIMRLPNEQVTWVCYNDDMIPYYETLIKELRGVDYYEQYVTVIASGQALNGSNTFLDPSLYELRGNGYD